MARKFLSFLGTTDYQACTYKYGPSEDLKWFTKYIQEALLRIFCSDWTKEDTAVIFVTDKAEKLNWYNEDDENRRLKTIMEELNINVKAVSIPEGKTEDEIWQIFHIVTNEIEDDDEVIFDITHSFRSIPMLALVVLNYAKVVKNAKLLGIYYGAFEPNNDSAVIFDLTPLNDILEWSQAVHVFLDYGLSGPLKDISTRQLKHHLRSEQWARDTRQFVDSLNNLTMCLYTCRGKAITGKGTARKSISSAVEIAKENFGRTKGIDEENQLKPLLPLMEKIEKRLEIFKGNDNLSIGIAAIQWYIENNLIEQAYTALDETIKTYACIKFGLDDADYNNREEIVQKALKIRELSVPEEKWIVKDQYRHKVKELVEKLDDELVVLSSKIGSKRNDINHFGFNDNASNYTDLESNIYECFNRFLDYIYSN
ncbi:MAG: TIGR02221 family CRISPR-associated protein [Tissierellia bacterium]|nr:TIGR02221 family CRISPR-associated protein [Tissierellia bacterium]